MNDTDMLSYAAVEKENAETRELLCELRPILRKAFFAHWCASSVIMICGYCQTLARKRQREEGRLRYGKIQVRDK